MNPGEGESVDPAAGRFACAGCGALIGRDETVLVLSPHGTYHVSALGRLEPELLASVSIVWHAGCYSEERR